MIFDRHTLGKALSPKMAAKIIESFDRATIVVVAACWAAAVLMMVFAVYTVLASTSAKRAAEIASAVEPALPQIVINPVEVSVAQDLITRLSRRYPDIKFSLANDQNLKVTAQDGSKYRQWLTAISYIDTAFPNYHWTLEYFCVGKCRGELMNAVLKAERISFTVPETPK